MHCRFPTPSRSRLDPPSRPRSLADAEPDRVMKIHRSVPFGAGQGFVSFAGAVSRRADSMEAVAMTDAVHDGPAMNALFHKAVRRDLDGFAAALKEFPAGNKDRAGVIAARFHWFDILLTHHHEGEEQILWPVLRGTPADTPEVGELTDEHEQIVNTLAAARTAMSSLGATASAADAQAALPAIGDLRAAALEHFAPRGGRDGRTLLPCRPGSARGRFEKARPERADARGSVVPAMGR